MKTTQRKKSSLFPLALGVTGLGSLALHVALWFNGSFEEFGRGGWEHSGFLPHCPGPMGFGGLLGVFFVLLLIGGLFRMARGAHSGHHNQAPHHRLWVDPLADLAEAYAEGKITREQYAERKAVLEELA